MDAEIQGKKLEAIVEQKSGCGGYIIGAFVILFIYFAMSGSCSSSSPSTSSHSSSSSSYSSSYSHSSGGSSSSSSNSSSSTAPRPANGAILIGSESYESQITVIANGTEDAYVKLKTASGETVIAFYVRAGQTATVGVPGRVLYVYFATGTSWYGSSKAFGSSGSYSMDDEPNDFSQYTLTYTLQASSDGNFSETPISQGDF